MEATTQTITPFLWFNNQAEEAVHFYTSIFQNSSVKTVTRYTDSGADVSGMPKGAVMTIAFQLEGQEFVALNGGPVFELSPVISFFVSCDTPQEIDRLWEKLSEGGSVLMALDKYPFSEKYGWIQDRYGVSWQLILQDRPRKIAPCLMFSGDQHKKAEEAIRFYLSVFDDSTIVQLEHYLADQGPEGAVVHGRFTLQGQDFIAMDSHEPMSYNFTPAISFVVNCASQQEVDSFWEKLSEGGDEKYQVCGWLQDKFGVSWQVVPTALQEMLKASDPDRSERVMKALYQMKKIDLAVLESVQ